MKHVRRTSTVYAWQRTMQYTTPLAYAIHSRCTPATLIEEKEMGQAMSEQEAARRIIIWAFQHFGAKMVEVLSIEYDEDEEEWEAELEVDTSADNPHVTFFEDSMYANGIQVSHVEY